MTQLTIAPWQQGLEKASIERGDQLAIQTRAALHTLRGAWVDVAELLATAQAEMKPAAFASWYQQELGLNKQKVSEFVSAKWVMDYAPGVFNETNSSARALRLLKSADDEGLMNMAQHHVESGHKLTRTWVEEKAQWCKELAEQTRKQKLEWGYVEHPDTGEMVMPTELPGYSPEVHECKLSKADELIEAARERKEEVERRLAEAKARKEQSDQEWERAKLGFVTVDNFLGTEPVAPGDPEPASEQTVEVRANTELDDAYERIAALEDRLLVIGEWAEGLVRNGQVNIREAMGEEVQRAIADETFEIPFEDDTNPAQFWLHKIENTPSGRARLCLDNTKTLINHVLAKSDNFCPEVIAECKDTFRELTDEIIDWL